MSPAPDERDRIRAAMDRILAGAPEHSNGALTIVALAQEAQVPRNALTQRHLDLQNEFYEKVRARGALPDSEKRLRRQVTKPKELRAADAKELAALRSDVEGSAPCTKRRWRTDNCANGSPLQTQPCARCPQSPGREPSGDVPERLAAARGGTSALHRNVTKPAPTTPRR